MDRANMLKVFIEHPGDVVIGFYPGRGGSYVCEYVDTRTGTLLHRRVIRDAGPI